MQPLVREPGGGGRVGAQSAVPFQLANRKPIMPIGRFNGAD